MLTYPSISLGADLVCDDINNHKKRSLLGDISMSLIHLHVGLTATTGQLLALVVWYQVVGPINYVRCY